jgi:tRNA G18 (ribose-2'-O)-methylase SpoU
LGGITPTPESKRVSQTSLGAEKSIGWTNIPNSIEKIFELKAKHYFVVVLEEHQNPNCNLYTTKLQIDYQLVQVVGNEVCGTDPEIRELCDLILSIPMLGLKKNHSTLQLHLVLHLAQSNSII